MFIGDDSGRLAELAKMMPPSARALTDGTATEPAAGTVPDGAQGIHIKPN